MPQERRSTTRREKDKELEQMSKEALETAKEAQNSINTHLAVCEIQQRDILRRLGMQDKVLYGIAAGVGIELFHTIAAKLFG